MSVSSLLELAKKRIVLLDGGMGTELMKKGLPQGTCPEAWNLSHPEIVRDVHRSYYEAGADAASTNSLGGNRIKLSHQGLADRCRELNVTAARIACEARPSGRFVVGSMGPTGKFLKPHGEYEESEFEDVFAEQASALAEGGVDVFLVETFYDLLEALCAVRGIRRSSSLPVFATMTFNRTPRGYFTLMGNDPARCVKDLEAAGVAALGTNCTLNSEEMTGLILELSKTASVPLIAQPNAGRAEINALGGTSYAQGIETFLKHVPAILRNGARIVGGCCGTNPDYIKRIAEVLKIS